MEVKLAECAGFCFGVKRAVDTVYEQLNRDKIIYTYGPIVHNEEVVRELEEKGVCVLENTDQTREVKRGSVIIRAHGISREVQQDLEDAGLECIDATCPFVKRIHNIVDKASAEGKYVVVVGNDSHPEVEGIKGWCRGPVCAVETAEEVERLCKSFDDEIQKAGKSPDMFEICIVSQTTFNYNKFQDIVEIFQKKGYNINIMNTICNATEERQKSAQNLARKADVMIVIGGKHSSNTRKLYEICKAECANTYYIQTLEDLHLEIPKAATLVGITAGASTPNKLIEEVQNYVRINF
ncbi:MAG: 4-hydroxy-3-methylbut-2-enyl diphosphate reductase [Lachnospiraceae bacterium]|nr:4-hydroxy-3-methylbut-2-enyl diphosphate reductase [Lachnospiraceae bacterium]